jgi:ankyrin repeat protein
MNKFTKTIVVLASVIITPAILFFLTSVIFVSGLVEYKASLFQGEEFYVFGKRVDSWFGAFKILVWGSYIASIPLGIFIGCKLIKRPDNTSTPTVKTKNVIPVLTVIIVLASPFFGAVGIFLLSGPQAPNLSIHKAVVQGNTEAATPEPSTAKTPDISIHKASERGNIEAVKQHLDTGEDVNVKSDSGMTPLHHAAYRENNEVIELLIAKGASVNAQDVAGRTPLNVAIRYKRTKSADLLRKHGGKTSNWLNADDSIHSAASAGHIEAVKQHLANGVDVNAKTKSGFTPLDTAIRRNHPETADLLRTHGGKSGAEYSIHVAAELGNIEAVKEHLNAGIDVDARDQADKTPLPHAAYWGHKEIVELLISKGANVNARDKRGSTPLNWANENRQTEIADLIRNHGGKIFKSFSALDNKENRQPPPQTRRQDK